MPTLSHDEQSRRLTEYAQAMEQTRRVGGRLITEALLDWANYTTGVIDALEREALAGAPGIAVMTRRARPC